MVEVKLPELGKDVEAATVSFWYRKEGDAVAAGADLVELTTEKTSFTLSAPEAGVLEKVFVPEGSRATTGQVLAQIK